MRSAAARAEAAAGSVAAGGGWLAGTSNACPSLSCDGARLVDVVMMSQYKKSSRLLPELFKQKNSNARLLDYRYAGCCGLLCRGPQGMESVCRGYGEGMAGEYPGGFRLRCQATVRRM